MPTEKDVKDAARRRKELGRNPICSVSGASCADQCLAGGGCKALQPGVDPIPVKTVRQLATLKLHLGICKDDCDLLAGFSDFYRVWPQPEIRDIRRKITTAQAMVNELIGARR